MQKLTKDEEIEQVRSNLKRCKTLADTLTLDWIKKQILQKMEKTKIHKLFWLLLDEDKSQNLDNWLTTLKTILPDSKFKGLINKIKKSSGEIEFFSLLSEIEVVSYYSSKGHVLEYEPPKGDLKLSLNGSEIFIEIARLFSSQEEQRINSLAHLIWNKLDNLEDNKYLISFGISPSFSESDVNSFVEFASDILAKEFKTFPSEKFIFNSGKASITVLSISKNGKGRVAGNLVGVMEIHSSARLKNKILDEVKQLPRDKLNIVVYNITHFFTHFDDIEDAFYGQSALRLYVSKENGVVHKEPVRKENGVVHKEEGRQISAIIAYEGFNYDKRRKYPNPEAKVQIKKELLERI